MSDSCHIFIDSRKRTFIM